MEEREEFSDDFDAVGYYMVRMSNDDYVDYDDNYDD